MPGYERKNILYRAAEAEEEIEIIKLSWKAERENKALSPKFFCLKKLHLEFALEELHLQFHWQAWLPNSSYCIPSCLTPLSLLSTPPQWTLVSSHFTAFSQQKQTSIFSLPKHTSTGEELTLPELHCTYAILCPRCAWPCSGLVTMWTCLVVTVLLAEPDITGPAIPPGYGWGTAPYSAQAISWRWPLSQIPYK